MLFPPIIADDMRKAERGLLMKIEEEEEGGFGGCMGIIAHLRLILLL